MTGPRTLDVMDGPVELPRSNGELVFGAPWESRAFGLAVALCDQGLFEWEAFREQLVAEIERADAERAAGGAAEAGYYVRWLTALERLLERLDVVGAEDIGRRVHERALHEHDH